MRRPSNGRRPLVLRTGSLRAWVFRVVTAFVAPLVVIGALEIVLRLAGVGHPSTFTLRCEANGERAWCDSPWFSRPFFPPGAFRLPPPFAIPAKKPSGTTRIFVIGESAAMGDPEPDYGLARTLDVMLASRYPHRRFEVIDAAVTSINSHVILPIVRDLASKDGDIFLVYMGNNEVVGHAGETTVLTPRSSSLALIRAGLALQATRLGQVTERLLRRVSRASDEARGMDLFLKRQVRDGSRGLAVVRDHFRANLRDIIGVARRAGAQVIVSTVATNVADCAPFASLHRERLPPEQVALFDTEYRAGVACEAAGDWDCARARFAAAVRVDDQFADAQFRLGHALSALGDIPGARAAFALARDLDTLRFRADSHLNEIIREEAHRGGHGVSLVDAVAAFDAASPHGLVGGGLFWEHVHFTPEGTDVLARAFLARLDDVLPPEIRREATPVLDTEEVHRRLALTPFDRSRMSEDIAKRLERAPFTNQLDHHARLAEARRRSASALSAVESTLDAYYGAIRLRPDDGALLSRAGRLLVDRDPAGAEGLLRRATALLPSDPVTHDAHANVLVKLGRIDEAARECRALLEWMPFHPPAWLTLAYVLAEQRRYEEAIGAYEQAARLAPQLAADAANEVGRIRLAQGRWSDAADAFARSAAAYGIDARAADAFFNRGHALRKAGRSPEAAAALGEAAARYRRELAQAPASALLHYGLANTLIEQGDPAGAAAHYSLAVNADPTDAAAHTGLVKALALTGRFDQASAAARRGVAALAAAGRAADASQLARLAGALEQRTGAPSK